jgi:hypothetical protein
MFKQLLMIATLLGVSAVQNIFSMNLNHLCKRRLARIAKKPYPLNTRLVRYEKDNRGNYQYRTKDGRIERPIIATFNTDNEVYIGENKPIENIKFLVRYFNWEPISNLVTKWIAKVKKRVGKDTSFGLFYKDLQKKHSILLNTTDRCATLDKYIKRSKEANKEFCLDITICNALNLYTL